ncbi:MAG TPA: AmmeMemoRadiSam system protein B [Myxococcaceae bacterium]|nr:AmmeMemoRadiSam system protein B [Myxococcaceae bacterium]
MSSNSVSKVRRPAVAGSFYPGHPEALRGTVDRLLAQAAPPPIHGSLRALIAPHAGYVYSGPIAASAYAVLAWASPPPRRIVLLGPSHHLGFSGLALPEAEALETPLGVVPIDSLAASLPERFPQVLRSDRAHQREHSLEVQLPFLQRVLPAGFTVVPLAVGRAGPEEVSEVIEFLWRHPGTLVLVSTDLSHHLPAGEARVVDTRTSELIVAEEPGALDADMACGYHPLAGLLLAARRAGLSIELLDLRNSSDTAGDPDQVVGYGAFAVVEGRSASG